MTREYLFAKKVTEEQAAEILAEGNELAGAEKVVIDDDALTLTVSCQTNEDFEAVMERLVNIVSRITGGNSFSFTKFIYEG